MVIFEKPCTATPILHNCYGRLTHCITNFVFNQWSSFLQGGGGLLLKLWECFSVVLTKLYRIPLSSALLSLNCCELYIKCINHQSQRPGEPLGGGVCSSQEGVFGNTWDKVNDGAQGSWWHSSELRSQPQETLWKVSIIIRSQAETPSGTAGGPCELGLVLALEEPPHTFPKQLLQCNLGPLWIKVFVVHLTQMYVDAVGSCIISQKLKQSSGECLVIVFKMYHIFRKSWFQR